MSGGGDLEQMRARAEAAEAALKSEHARAEAWEATARLISKPGKSLFCECSSVYSYTEDGGKTIHCLLCSWRKRKSIDAALSEARKDTARLDKLERLAIKAGFSWFEVSEYGDIYTNYTQGDGDYASIREAIDAAPEPTR